MGQAVVTSLGLPRWRAEAQNWPRAWVLTPTPQLLAETDAETFAAGYAVRLTRLGVQKIARVLEQIAVDHDASTLVLLCHEADWDTCHRQQFASWWLTTTGEAIAEIT
jgi:hypothetical protein